MIQFMERQMRLWKPGDLSNSGMQNAIFFDKEESQNDFDHPGTGFS